jgi:hypothetical protein
LGGDLGDCPCGVAGAEKVANGGELVFGLFGKCFLFSGCDRNFFDFGYAFYDGLGANFFGGLVLRILWFSFSVFQRTLADAITDDYRVHHLKELQIKKLPLRRAFLFVQESISKINR